MVKMTRSLAALGLLAAVFLLVAPLSDAGPGRTCLSQPDTYCGFNCSGLSYPACFDDDPVRCCWDGPNSCGESTSCGGFCGCSEDPGF
jgi:hypothetical protein